MYQAIKIDSYDAYEPYISAYTMNIHYNKHYKKYLDNLNNLISKYNYDYTKEELVQNIDMFPLSERGNILFNLGGVLNHEMYFDILGNGNLSESLSNKINADFGSFDNFKEEFIKSANTLVGSGYTFLVVNKEGNLEIINVANQDTPYSYGLIPIMNIDLWEHAYYLDYQNRKDEYINKFFSIVDFSKVSNNYEKAKIQENL